MSRLSLSLALVAVLCSVSAGQIAYVSNSGWSFSSAYVGQDLDPAPNQFDQDDELGTLTSEAEAFWDNDAAWAQADLSAGGIIEHLQATAGADNTYRAGPSTGDENAAWSTAEQSGMWTTGEQPVTYTFVANLAVTDETMTGSGLYWSAETFLSGEATAGPFEFTWELKNGYLQWKLHDSGYQIDSGSKLVFPLGGSDWVASVTKSVTDQSPAASELLSCSTDVSTFKLLDYFAVRSGEAQTGVIIAD